MGHAVYPSTRPCAFGCENTAKDGEADSLDVVHYALSARPTVPSPRPVLAAICLRLAPCSLKR